MITASNLSNALKILYRGQKMEEVIFGNPTRVLMNDLKKMEDFSGDTYPLPVYFEDAAGGRSAGFSAAQSNNSAMQLGKFAIDVVENHQVVRVSTNALLRSRNSKGSFLAHQKIRVDTSLNNLANDVEKSLYRSSTGEIGRLNSSSFATTTLDLVTDKDAKNFFIGQKVVFASSTTGALRDSGQAIEVSGVDFEATTGQVTLAENMNVISGIAQNDYIFPEGDAANGSGTNLKITGLEEWIPSSAPGATAFFGQDRSLHPTRLGGSRQTGSLSDIRKAVVDACAHLGDIALAAPAKAYMSYTTWATLVDQLEADVQRKPARGTTAGYQYVTIYGARGPVECIPATFCQESLIWLLTMSTWELVSMGRCVRINDDDGLMARAISTQSGLEIRADSHAQLACNAPGKSCRITLS